MDSDDVREVRLTPNSEWGGEGCLGCDIGYGYFTLKRFYFYRYLHRIPVSLDRSKHSNNQNNSYKPTVVQEERNALLVNIPAPGATGIPQIDQISATRQFPNPSEFNLQHKSSPVLQSVNGISAPSQNGFSNMPPPSLPYSLAKENQGQSNEECTHQQAVKFF